MISWVSEPVADFVTISVIACVSEPVPDSVTISVIVFVLPHVGPTKPGLQVHWHAVLPALDVTAVALLLQCVAVVHCKWHTTEHFFLLPTSFGLKRKKGGSIYNRRSGIRGTPHPYG